MLLKQAFAQSGYRLQNQWAILSLRPFADRMFMTQPTLREAPLKFSSPLAQDDQERQSDTLNLLPYAEALREFIQDCQTPMTIGIQGDWGIGKTSLMNMLRGQADLPTSGLLDDKRCCLVNLEIWPYAQFYDGNPLVMACLQALTEQVARALSQTELDTDSIEKLASRARKKLHKVARHVGPNPLNPGTDEFSADLSEDISAQMIDFRQMFAELVDTWAGQQPLRRVVVFVDDLNRVTPIEALLLLESVKNFMNVPGCVFVLAVDYAVIQQGVTQKLGAEVQRLSGKAYYDKLIQLPFVMPAASYRISQYIGGLLQSSGFPFSDQLVANPQSQDFFLEITLCTVGRNPRNIKRVMNYATLLEHVRDHQNTSAQLQPRDAQILYALVCMQIAWPELFQHFVQDPTVDTVTSLQNWDYLDGLPELQRMFEREPDRERVKVNIGAFFDTLFSLLDENDDGQVDSAELGPVLDVMALARMTAVELRVRPRDWFIEKVRDNNTNNDELIETFLDRVFMRSVWYLGSECRYRKCGSRYVMLVHNGRQIGSLVSLRSQPFVFRLALRPEKVKSGLKAYWKSKQKVNTEAITMTRSVFGKEASMTGFGDTVVDYSKLTNMPSKEAISLLNALFRIAIHDELPEWELDNGDKK